jgi:magnesium chelatase subunit H
VVGQPPSAEERVDLLLAVAEAAHGAHPDRAAVAALVAGRSPEAAAPDAAGADLLRELAATDRMLTQDHELAGILQALDGRYVRPAPGGDLLRTPAVLPTGRNLHGFDPYRIPSAFAVADGARQAAKLLARHVAEGNTFPESVALVLWGTDNLKTEGGPIAQALALIGARPRFDSYGRLCGAALIPLEELGRPRVDVMADPVREFFAISCRSRPGCWPRPHTSPRAPTNRSPGTSCASTRWPTRRRMAATWRWPRCGCSPTPTAPTAPTSTT